MNHGNGKSVSSFYFFLWIFPSLPPPSPIGMIHRMTLEEEDDGWFIRRQLAMNIEYESKRKVNTVIVRWSDSQIGSQVKSVSR